MSERRRLCITKRACIALMLFVVAGAIVNVAVAWGCAAWSNPLVALPLRVFADETIWWQHNIPEGFPMGADEFHGGNAWGTDYVMIMALNKPVNAMSYTAYRWQSGWPMRSLERSLWSNLDAGMRQIRHTLVLDDSSKPRRIVPLRPIWPGFAINTVFYAFILWLVFAAPFAWRRRRRIRRGLCPKCAYPVGTNRVCTECGAAVANPKECL